MAILKVARLGHPVLRQPARELTRGEIRSAEVQRLIDDMRETMYEYEGVGLAAPQVHAALRLAVLEIQGGEEDDRGAVPFTVLLNPTITPLGDEKASDWEGCLSVPDLRGPVARFQSVRVEALDRQGKPWSVEATGFFARVLQHECDHLDGMVFLDRMDGLRGLSFQKEYETYVLRDEGE